MDKVLQAMDFDKKSLENWITVVLAWWCLQLF